ncbi:MAG: hypothetical protein PVG39_14665 [Desulfobacteraceae bacterium]|jgi:hypothetical protein
MLAEYKTKTNIGVGLGIIAQILGRFLANNEGVISLFGLLLQIAGAVLFIWGCCMYSKGKGHHGAWGLLGLLSIIGLIILFFFKDKHK